MSFFRCCVGADPRPSSESQRPTPSTNRRTTPQPPESADPPHSSKKKMKLPNEVFFDPTKPDGQLSSVTDPANSTRDLTDLKKRKDPKDRPHSAAPRDPRKPPAKLSTPAAPDNQKNDLDAQDNNGLTRGQNFMKVEKWLRASLMFNQIDITPGEITNIEDTPPQLPDSADPPSEKDRLPPALSNPSFTQAASR